ncbi:MAG: Hsp70 family protein, partial [Planctomycetaceae bacterium]
VLEGEASDPDACTLIGDFRVFNLPEDLPPGSPVELTYHYNASGRISASAKEVVGNNEASTEIVRDSGLTENDLSTALERLTKEYQIE